MQRHTLNKQKTNHCYFGDCRDSMRKMIADGVKVQMCVTSPPYYGLRDYGHPDQLGLEDTPEQYIANMVDVFRLVKDLLADDGVLWLNIGDSYCASKTGTSDQTSSTLGGGKDNQIEAGKRPDKSKLPGVKPKDLIGIPWMLAFALRADGWYLRQDIIWAKPNPMPESVTDRCTKSHEYIFLLSKSQKYYFDADAIAEPAAYDGRKDTMMKGSAKYENGFVPNQSTQTMAARGHERWNKDADGNYVRNKRSVWTVNTKPYSGAHFAVFPEELIVPCILAGSRVGGTVLDPFFGSGTTGQVSQALRRNWIGCELNTEYEQLQNMRLGRNYKLKKKEDQNGFFL